MTLNLDDRSAGAPDPDAARLPARHDRAAMKQAAAVYARPLFSQAAGMIGLLWCLIDGHPIIATALALLITADQALFLRGRLGVEALQLRSHRVLDLVCFGASAVDLLIFWAVLFRAAGLRVLPGDTPATGPMDALAFTLATVLHTGSDLGPGTASGRLLATAVAAIGGALLFAGAVRAALWIAGRTGGAAAEVVQEVPYRAWKESATMDGQGEDVA